MARDVPEQHLRAQDAARSRDFFQATLDCLATEVAVLDGHGSVVMCNRAWTAFARTCAAGAGTEVGENYLEPCGASPDRTTASIATALREIIGGTRDEFATEYPCHEPDTDQWFALRATRYDGPGSARVVVARDEITAARQAERALIAAQNYARAVADSMGEGLCTIDSQGRLTYANEAAEKLLGWSAQNMRGRRWHDLVHADRPGERVCESDACPITRAIHETGPVRVEEDAFTCRDGSWLQAAFTASPFVTDDGIDGCTVVFEDITERKQRQASMERDVETLSWIGRIQEALAQDRFELFAQPIVDLRSGETVQRELLLRMREPSGEIVPPISYLPIAERYGLIADIDRWVIGRATQIAAELGPVQLNLSACSIGDPTLVDRIEQCLEVTGADPSSLVFEITETALIADETAATVFVERVHALGCKLALDDFGTGYGGFTYLKHLAVDLLKIDVEFVRDLATNSASRHVVEAVVALAGAFGLQTVAEGVEDAVALELIGELGVDFAQGYYIARPAPLDQPVALIYSSVDDTQVHSNERKRS